MNDTIKEVWNRRSLIINLAISDLKLRYRNSTIGFFWSFLEPLLMLTVLYLVFTNIFKGTLEHYPLFLLQGLIMWSAFSRGTSMGMESIMNKSGLVSQIYLPREVLVLSGVLTSFLMMIFEFMVFFVFMIVFQVMPAITIVLLAPMLILLFLFTLGISFGLSSLYIYYRDLRAIWGVVLQAGFFLGTIIYTIDIFPENVRPLISLNPFVPLLEISRNATIYNKWPSTDSGLLYLLLIILIVNIGGYAIFKKLDKRLVEEL